jgi:CspA family cold shock protein
MHREKRPDDLAREAAGDPSERLGTEAISVGTVKLWKDDKGYGVIACAVTAPWDIWCHFSAIDAPGFKSLTEGETVTVDYLRGNQGSFRYVARRVRRIDGAGVAHAG